MFSYFLLGLTDIHLIAQKYVREKYDSIKKMGILHSKNKTPRLQRNIKLNSADFYNFLHTHKGIEWLNGKEGAQWLTSDDGASWYLSDSSLYCRALCDRRLTIYLLYNLDKLPHKRCYELLSISTCLARCEWLHSAQGYKFLISPLGSKWLRTNGYNWLLTSVDWLHTTIGRDFLLTKNGNCFIHWFKAWKDTSEGIGWLLTHDGQYWDKRKTTEYILIFQDCTYGKDYHSPRS